MKKLNYILMVLFAGLVFTACDDDDYSLGAPSDKTKALIGTWNVKSVTLTDEAGTKKEMDITPYFNFDSYKVTFNEDKSFSNIQNFFTHLTQLPGMIYHRKGYQTGGAYHV